MRPGSVIDQIQRDFPADTISFEDYYVYVGDRTRAFINVDEREIRSARAFSNRGRNYVVFLVMFLYNRFRLLPEPGSLSHQLISEIEIARVRSFHARMQRVGNGMGYYEYWDGERWRVKAVPVVDPDFRIQIPLPPPEGWQRPGDGASRRADQSDDRGDPLEELPRVGWALPEPTKPASDIDTDSVHT